MHISTLSREITEYKTALIRAKMEEYYNITHQGIRLPKWMDDEYKRFNSFINSRIEDLKKEPAKFHEIAYKTIL